ncbi:acyl-CoA synthetase [Roseomonas sp. CCTCC AB2023176]|uniref:acyl-CoA synthetase n=1 Tax=Roseomonas sp. CCTCC AB2023176 TaxID=3342640 RepID=UPI0035DD3D9E
MIPTANLATLLRWTARRFPDRPGLIQGARRWSWAELDRRVAAAAAGLAARGVRPGDRVLVHAKNSPPMFETMWACWTIGAVWVPTNHRLSPPEVAWLAQSSRAVAHVFDDAFPEHAAAAREANPACAAEIAIATDWDAMASADARADHADVSRDHPLWFFYTSGTTGRPKAGVLTHGQMGFVVNNHLADLLPGLTERDASLVVAPLSHGAGIHAMSNVARGAATVLTESERLDPEEAWRLVAEHRVSNMFTVPTILTALTRHDAVDLHDHSSVRHVIYAGAPMYREDQRHALRKLGKVIVQYFGLGEVTGNITVLPAEMHDEDDARMPVGSCGYPRTGMDLAILSDDGTRLPPGEDGEIAVRGNAVFAGYFENDAANAAAFKDGWFRTGDLGHLDERGLLYITGRRSDMYISGGSNVYPREVEEVLLTHPAIAEACVVGVPHSKWGECGVAVLVPRDGAVIEEEAVRALLPGRLARYKWPERIVVWDALPRSGYGKVPKNEVRRRLLDDA